jgi:hypothetical protein
MHARILSKALFALIGASLTYPALAGLASADGSSVRWIKLGATNDNVGTIYLSPHFGQKSGKFSAIPESVMDNQDSVEGNFLVGTYRMALDAPIKDEKGIPHDELIVTEVMDCKNDYFGSLHTIEKLKGKIVRDETVTDDKLDMVQTHDWTIDKQLCRLHQGEAPEPGNATASLP